MPRNPTTGVFTRVNNSFSEPVFGTEIDPADANVLFNDYDNGLNNIPASQITGTIPIPSGGTGESTAGAAFDALAPTTTRGDIIFRNATTNTRLGAGTAGYLLQTNGPGTDPSYAGFLQAGTGAVTRTWQDKGRDIVSVKDFGAIGDGVTDDAPAFRAAIDALSSGATLRVPHGTYLMNSVRNGAVLDFTGANASKGISIVGDGWNVNYNGTTWTAGSGSTVFALGGSITSTNDFIHIAGTGTIGNIGMQFRDFILTSTSGIYAGAVGRHGIYFDGTSSDHFFVENVIIDNIFIDNMATGYSIYANANATSINGIILISTISRSFLMSINLNNAADGVTIGPNNTFGQNAINDVRNQGVYLSAVSGATTQRVINNYFLNFNGMVVVNAGPDVIIQNNVFEQSGANAYGAMVDLNGGIIPLTGANVSGNRFSQLVGSTTIPLRINAATNTNVAGNWFFNNAVYPFITITSSANSTIIGDNYYQDSAGYKINGNISDAGIATKYDTPLYAWRAASNVPGIPASGKMFSWYDAADARFHDINSSSVVGTTVVSSSAPANRFATGIGTNGVISYAQPTLANLAGSAWTTYTPVLSSQSGSGATASSITGRYQQIGKVIIAEIDLTISAVGTAGGSLLVSLPTTAAAFRYAGSVYEYQVTGKSGAGYVAPSSSNLSTRVADGTLWWTVGYQLCATVVYEIP